MRPILLTLFASVLLLSGIPGHAAEYHLGQWIGTWQSGDKSGHFDLDLGRGSDGELVGNIDVSADGGRGQEFAVDLRYVKFEGDRFTAVFITPGRSAAAIKLSGTLSNEKGSGGWVARKRGDAQESEESMSSATGTWQLEKHER
jgi:hypothetical protein